MEVLLMVALGVGGVACQIPWRRGPHHPRGEALPPGAHRHHAAPSTKLTEDKAIIHDIAHLQEDLGRPLGDMSEEELEFYYFKLHDFDANNLLDGLELFKAIYHTLDHNHHESDENQEMGFLSPSGEEISRYVELIDQVLEEDDLNKDGFISYPEFAHGRSNGRAVDLTSKIVVDQI